MALIPAREYLANLYRHSMHLSAGASVLGILAMVASLQGRLVLAWYIIALAFGFNWRALVMRKRARRVIEWLAKD